MRRVLTVIAIAAIGLLPMPATAQATPTCFGKTATIVGTEEDDTLSGTTGTDVIAALDGHDTVLGWHDPEPTYPHLPAQPDEMDYICGGANAGPGGGGDPDEDLWGGYGRDRIAGGGGADSLLGGVGNDVLEGGSGNDFIYGEGGHDRAVWGRDERALRQQPHRRSRRRLSGGQARDGGPLLGRKWLRHLRDGPGGWHIQGPV